MGLYVKSITLLLNHPYAKSWPQLNEALQRALARPPVAWHFPVKACEAIGADAERALPAVAAITCAHMALILIDDILDEDPRGAHLKVGSGRAANLAMGLNSLAIDILLNRRDFPNRDHAATALNQMIGSTAYGQDLDVQNAHTEEGYWAVTRAKSSPYFGSAMHLGALCTDASFELAVQLARFGEIYGEIMQIHDDLNDCLATPANVDWAQSRSPLPILFAQLVDHPQRARFVQLRGQVADPRALEEAQSILVSSGAISYCVHELIARHDLAKEIISKLQLAHPESLEQLLEEALAPIKNLFAKVGAKPMEMPV